MQPPRFVGVRRAAGMVLASTLVSLHALAGLNEATDAAGTWTSGSVQYSSTDPGTPDLWAGQSVVSLDGTDAAEGRLDGGSGVEAWMELTFTGPTTLYFSYRIKDFSGPYSGPANGLFLTVGAVQSLISPDTGTIGTDSGWREGSASIPAGEHIVRWTLAYYRGGSPVRAYVDQVWTSTDARPRLASTPAQTAQFTTPYEWTVPVSSLSPATLSATGLPPGLTADADTFVISGTPTAAGNFEATLTAHNAAGQHNRTVSFQVEPGTTSLPEALDAAAMGFSQPDDATHWTGITGEGHDRIDSARASLILGASGGFTGHLLTPLVNGPGTLRFWYRNDERGASHDRTIINLFIGPLTPPSQPVQQLTETVWTQGSIAVPAGPHPISWGAVRANAFGPNLPVLYAYLDGVEFTPSTIPPQSTFAAWTTAWNVAGQPATSDADGDGLSLLMEYATGGSPYQPNPELLPTTSIVESYFTLRFTKASSPTDLLYFVQGSRDLAPNGWTTSSVEVQEEDGTHILAQSKKPIDEQPVFQMRVRVLQAP